MKAEELTLAKRNSHHGRGLSPDEVRLRFYPKSNYCFLVKYGERITKETGDPDYMTFAVFDGRLYLVPAADARCGFKVHKSGHLLPLRCAYMPVRVIPDDIRFKDITGCYMAHKDPECGYYYVNFSEVRE